MRWASREGGRLWWAGRGSTRKRASPGACRCEHVAVRGGWVVGYRSGRAGRQRRRCPWWAALIEEARPRQAALTEVPRGPGGQPRKRAARDSTRPWQGPCRMLGGDVRTSWSHACRFPQQEETLVTAASRQFDTADISSIQFWSQPPSVWDDTFRTLRDARPVSWHKAPEGSLLPTPPDDGFWAVVRTPTSWPSAVSRISIYPARVCSSRSCPTTSSRRPSPSSPWTPRAI